MANRWKTLAGALVPALTCQLAIVHPAMAELFVAYPPSTHTTVSDRIFFIGTGAPDSDVLINGTPITDRSSAGHFAPTVPLAIGQNQFTITQGSESITFNITRDSLEPPQINGIAFAENTLEPSRSIARQPGELVCFEAVAPPQAQVAVNLAGQSIALRVQPGSFELPPNYAVLTEQTEPYALNAAQYGGCATFNQPGSFGTPEFQLTLNGQTITQAGSGSIEILSPTSFQVAEVTVESGIARTGPSTDYSRLTPLPQGTSATVTGREGDWVRLDYGAWIRASEVSISPSPIPVTTTIRGIRSRQVADWTEVIFPLQVPVPMTVEQDINSLTLILHNTVPQTDTIFFSDNPVVERMDWQPILPDKASYTFHFKTDQQWGYKLRYEGTNLILSLKHPPAIDATVAPLQGTTILLDPGHGSSEDLGARGPNGYPEKDVALLISKLVRDELEVLGAEVVMVREGDDDLFPRDRVAVIEATEPTMALSLHYNALPDNGDALNTAGIGAFWYHPQAHDLALFLHNYLVETLDRPAYGVYWNNLALTRPSVTPSVLLELGFMINPYEFEWIVNPESQQQLAKALANGVAEWVVNQ
ncbi:N-acetylmuramoyl-L-alanine amidase [Adonisia turfae]|uniref:N-acetylmuramoyl-L-alanine amidase n=1 Tax=Adonisia turfae CCMR0081 TaxID=2292702 RepID=A0A6M0RKA3_9CYAN|nr:N-acetylmuramoyl-L-alanine amidase [Adonisia turfae]NEZ56688.1 N-acetylmuramoyl-L-alanine amidase [Adonisia turfae CCMR0081]